MHDFTRPVDVLDECAYKIAFLYDFITQPIARTENPFLSNDGAQGLSLILYEIKQAMFKATTIIVEQRQKTREV